MKKTMTMPRIRPKTPGQHRVFDAWNAHEHMVIYGSSGTGKSFLSMYFGLRDQRRIIIVRSAVQTRNIGHLPGTVEEKMSAYEQPYADIAHELNHDYNALLRDGMIEFTSTSFLRSLTWLDANVIVDEAQNMTWHELNSVMTRIGEGTRVIVCGDLAQNDLGKYETTGFERFLRVARRTGVFGEVEMTSEDIVRSGFVKLWICATEDEKE